MRGEIIKMDNLEKCFLTAVREKQKYVAILVHIPNQSRNQIIIDSVLDAQVRLEYIQQAYTENLELKTNNGIKIVGFTFANSLKEVEKDFEPYMTWNR